MPSRYFLAIVKRTCSQQELLVDGTHQLVALEPNTEDAKLDSGSALNTLLLRLQKSVHTYTSLLQRALLACSKSVILAYLSNNVQHSSHNLVLSGAFFYESTSEQDCDYQTWDGSRR